MSISSRDFAIGEPRRDAYLGDQPFFTRMAIAIALLIVFGFAQWSLRGFVSLSMTPWWVHAHGAFMALWLTVFVTQNILAERGAFELHRRLGWTALFVVVAVGVFASAAGIQALALHRIPPFFSNAYFLALTQIEVLLFVGTVVWAVVQRRKTQWHRRLMLGATVLLMEPALGRLLPMPLLGATGEWIVLAIQLLPIIVLARHDRVVIGVVHPATFSAAVIVVVAHLIVTGLSVLTPFIELANRIAGS